VKGRGLSLTVEDSMNCEAFEAQLERVLAATLRLGQIVMMYNSSTHKAKRIKEIEEKRGCEPLYLPYSPDFSPIEEALLKVKGLWRKAAARSWEALVEAIGAALAAVGASDS
jgi:transposase